MFYPIHGFGTHFSVQQRLSIIPDSPIFNASPRYLGFILKTCSSVNIYPSDKNQIEQRSTKDHTNKDINLDFHAKKTPTNPIMLKPQEI